MRQLLTVLAGLLAPALWAADEGTAQAAVPSLGAALLQVGGALALIIGLILAAAWLAKKTNVLGHYQQGRMKTLAMLPLGRKEKVALIEVCGQTFLIGIAQNQITLLHHFSDLSQAEVEAMSKPNAGDTTASTHPAFAQFLQTVMNSGKGNEK